LNAVLLGNGSWQTLGTGPRNKALSLHCFKSIARNSQTNLMLSSIIRYFRACYQADLRAVHLLNFFSSKVTFARLDADPEWISGRLHSHPVPTDWGAALNIM